MTTLSDPGIGLWPKPKESESFPRFYGTSNSSLEKFSNDVIPKLFSNYYFHHKGNVCLPKKKIGPKGDKHAEAEWQSSGHGQAPALFLGPLEPSKSWNCNHRTSPIWPYPVSNKNTGVGCHTLLQGIFPTQGSNPRLLRPTCIGSWILYHRHPLRSPSFPETIEHNSKSHGWSMGRGEHCDLT